MPSDKIINYYLLCSVRMGARKHIVNELPDKKIDVVFTKKEVSMYFRKQDGAWVPREVVIGGSDTCEPLPRCVVVE